MKIGDEITVSSGTWSVGMRNDMGGTTDLPKGRTYRVQLTRTFNDHEIGGRGVGILMSEEDVTLARKIGTTPYEPKLKDWNPAEVFFGMDEVIEVMNAGLTADQLTALRLFAKANGRRWKAELNTLWRTGAYSYSVLGGADPCYLQQIRNRFGPTWLVKFSFKKYDV